MIVMTDTEEGFWLDEYPRQATSVHISEESVFYRAYEHVDAFSMHQSLRCT